MLKDAVQAMKTDGNNERFPVFNVIPEFDPSKKNQTIEMWITKVNECAQIYNWSDRQTSHYALPKLVGFAQKWYQGLPSVMFSWSEWQDKLRLSFPSDENYAQLLSDMLACKARFGDSLEEYFYDKTVLLNRCNIIGKNAIDCILFGIEDRSIRTSAEAAQYSDLDKLLVYLKGAKINKRVDKTVRQAGITDNGRNKTNRTKTNMSESTAKCYNCGEEGHPYYKCKQTIKRCTACNKVGHLVNDCPGKKDKTPKTVLGISAEHENDCKYFKPALVNGETLDCFIDFGSQCSMLRESVARHLTITWSKNDLPVLRGFGDSMVSCIGKCNANIEIDSVKAVVPILIVSDHLLQVPLLLGQTFTEQDHVIVIKTNEVLQIKDKNRLKALRISLRVLNDSTISGYTSVDIYSETKYSGDLLIEPSLSHEPNREYEIIQSLVKLTDGRGQVVVRGLHSLVFTLKRDTLLVRAVPFTEMQTYCVNRIVGNNEELPNPTIDSSLINVGEELDKKDRESLFKLLNDYRDCFAFSTKELGCVKGIEMNIHLSDNSPIVYRPYRLAHSERQVVRGMVKELEDSGIVRPSTSDYASPILLVKKKTGDYRLCIDFRALNKKTIKEHYPLPRIDDQLDNLSGFKFYTSLDLASGYYQICMAETSKHLTAFVTPDGHFEFNRMPFGLANAPSNFQRAINNILGNARFKDAFAYMDDVIIPSKTIEEGFEKLRITLDIFRTSGITLKLSKCNFFMRSINYLGFEVNERGIRPGKHKIEAVEQFPRPTDQHKVRQFIGLSSFFRRFIKGFSIIAKPLTQLLKKDSLWCWGSIEEDSFQKLKTELTKRPVLAFYDPTYETQVHTDASKLGIAGILMQRPKRESPFSAVAYYSRQTSPEEARFTSYDLETLAVVMSVQQFRVYLLGLKFTIVTDCNSVRATFEKKDMIPRVARWWNSLQEYDFNIIYKPGSNMCHVDALSRNPVQQTECAEVRLIDTDWIATAQQNDSELQRIITILNDKETDNIIEIKNNFVVKRGLLYRQTPEGDRWVVPKGIRWHLLRTNHDMLGHFGFEKTYNKIKSQYWFAKMRRFVQKYVGSCLECAHTKVPAGKKSGKLHPIPKVDRPFHTLHIDHLGPFVRSKKKNSYLLLIIDAFTKYIILNPVKTTKSIHSIKALQNYFHTFGVPQRIISDRGTSFTSKKFKEFINSLGAKHVLNSVATPRANGQVERYNRTVLAALSAKNFNKNEKLWDEAVSEIQWALNNTYNKGTGKTPAEVLFGLKLIGINDSSLALTTNNAEAHDESTIETIRNQVSEHITKNQVNQKESFDKHRKKVVYAVGDLVRIEREIPSCGQSRKLVPKLRGPYRIITILDNDRYIVEDTPLSRKGNRPFTGTFSVDRIHPWLVFNRTNNESDNDSNNDQKTDDNEDEDNHSSQ